MASNSAGLRAVVNCFMCVAVYCRSEEKFIRRNSMVGHIFTKSFLQFLLIYTLQDCKPNPSKIRLSL